MTQAKVAAIQAARFIPDLYGSQLVVDSDLTQLEKIGPENSLDVYVIIAEVGEITN